MIKEKPSTTIITVVQGEVDEKQIEMKFKNLWPERAPKSPLTLGLMLGVGFGFGAFLLRNDFVIARIACRDVKVVPCNEDPLGVDIKTNSGNQGSTKRMKVDGHEQSTIKSKMGPHNTEKVNGNEDDEEIDVLGEGFEKILMTSILVLGAL
ncbi:hypothetical protein ACJX0J_036341, partial [Zea mays]